MRIIILYIHVYVGKRFQYTKVVVGDEIFIYRRITCVIILLYHCHYNIHTYIYHCAALVAR